MVTFWLLIDTIAMIVSPAWRGAVASVGCAGRAGGAALRAWAWAGDVVRGDSAARTASTMAGGHHRQIAPVDVDSAVANRSVMPCPPLNASVGPCQGRIATQ